MGGAIFYAAPCMLPTGLSVPQRVPESPRGSLGVRFGQQQAAGLDYLEEFVIRPIQAIHLHWEQRARIVGGWWTGSATDQLIGWCRLGTQVSRVLRSEWRVGILILHFRYFNILLRFCQIHIRSNSK